MLPEYLVHCDTCTNHVMRSVGCTCNVLFTVLVCTIDQHKVCSVCSAREIVVCM